MAGFRRWIMALAILAVFAGLASAQTSVPATCTLNPTNNTLRNESAADQVGDMTLVCIGGTLLADDANVPRVTFQLTLSQPITSRILKTVGAGPTAQSISEALLTVDEPGTGGGLIPNFGPNQAATACGFVGGTSNAGPTGCANTTVNGTGTIYKEDVGGIPVMAGSTGSPATGAQATAYNVYQGVISGNTVTWYGVPVLAPVSNGVARVFRITNVRTNSTGSAPGTAVTASLALSCTTTINCTTIGSVVTLSTSTATVGTVATGLSATNTKANPGSTTSCTGYTTTSPQLIGTIQFSENVGNAFRQRQVGAYTNTTVSNQQTLPGGNVLYSESGLFFANVETSGAPTGLADFGTRLKAVFSNIPSGVHLYVSTTNLLNATLSTYAVVPGNASANAVQSIAGLVSNSATGEFTVDGANGVFISAGTVTGSDGGTALDITSSGEAVWEVATTKGSAIDTFTFSIYAAYTAPGPVTGSTGTVATPTVVLSYAPSAALPTGQLVPPTPYFSILNTTSYSAFNITSCRTILLFPFVTSYPPFDTGIAISNTSKDPLGTTSQTGTCTLNFYGSNAPTATPSPVSVAGGTTGVVDVASVAPNFTGYMIAVCSFQYAHGFGYLAEVSNNYAGAQGYLALIIPDPGTGTRSPGAGGTGENLNQ